MVSARVIVVNQSWDSTAVCTRGVLCVSRVYPFLPHLLNSRRTRNAAAAAAAAAVATQMNDRLTHSASWRDPLRFLAIPFNQHYAYIVWEAILSLIHI